MSSKYWLYVQTVDSQSQETGVHESQICLTDTVEQVSLCSPWEKKYYALCQCVDFLCYLLTKQGAQWSHESRAQQGSNHRRASLGSQEKVTAGVEDRKITAVYVSCPIHLHSDAFISTLPCPLCSWSINKLHSEVLTTALSVCSVCLLRPAVWVEALGA